MTLLCIPHLILAALMGIHCRITTVSEVPVKAGDSVSVPCLYLPQYTDDVKYLCKGDKWRPCEIVVETNQQPCSGRFCICDDKKQRIFTVTINDLTDEDHRFWCAVEIVGLDVKRSFELSVTTGTPSLSVSQQIITAHEGGSVTVLCHYSNPKVTRWCRLGSSCVTAQTGSIDGTPMKINASVPKVFNVTMSDLRTESSGWYWCASKDLQMPVHITVLVLTSTTTTTLWPIRGETLSTTRHLLTSTETRSAPPANSTINGTGSGSPRDDHKSFTMVTIVTTTLVVLLLVVPAACFGWRMIMHNRSKPEACDINVGTPTSDSDVAYATVVHNQHAGAKIKQDCFPAESVTYSTIVLKDNMQQMIEPADGSVVYSTLKYNEPK